MLITAISSYLHTTPQNANDRTIHKRNDFTGKQRRFWHESDDGGAEEEDDDNEMVDFMITGDRLAMRHHGLS